MSNHASSAERGSNLGSEYLDRDLLGVPAPPAYTISQRSPPAPPPPPSAQASSPHASPPLPPLVSPEIAAPNPFQDPRPQRTPSISGPSQRLVASLDFGTTFSGFAFTTADADHEVDLSKIEVLQDWSPRMSNMDKIPSVKSYTSSTNGEGQWGTDLSENAITMVNQKLELEQQNNKIDELDLTMYVLRGTGNLSFKHIKQAGPIPEFSCKPPEEVVTDYLQHIFERARTEINEEQLARTKTPVDLVITVPVSWSYEGYNSLFKAVRKAGFNSKSLPTLKDTILVYEPEAAAYFTARDLKECGTDFLQEGQCFILCDAGGGTVDAVAFQVKQVRPLLRLQRVTEPTGAKCGSALIDAEFKRWLREVLGKERYAKLDPMNARQHRISPHTAESAAMRGLIKQFSSRKEAFSNDDYAPIKLDLPPPLDALNIEGRVDQGELTLYWQEMKSLMDKCVNEAITLVLDQIQQVKQNEGRRVKNVFLVGGFGASPYLQEEFKANLGVLKQSLRRPDANKSLTAVVQGGVIYGLEKARHRNVAYLKAAKKSYGILSTRGRFEWVIRKGDLVFSNKPGTRESNSFWHNPRQNVVRGMYEFGVFAYNENGDESDDDLPEDWQDGQHEVTLVGTVRVDFRYPFSGSNGEPRWPTTPVVPGDSRLNDPTVPMIGPLKWRMMLSETAIDAQLVWKDRAAPVGRCVGSCRIKINPLHLASGRRSADSVDGFENR